MAMKAHTQRADPSAPYTVVARRERSRELAQKRRTTYKTLMQDLAIELPFSKDVVNQVDYNSRLRLALCFFRMKSLLTPQEEEMIEEKMVEYDEKPSSLLAGVLQEFMTEALDGFLMVMLSDGHIVYLSESIHKHLGLFQSEHIGFSLYDLVLNEDHEDVRKAIGKAEAAALARLTDQATVNCTFFCRMKCSRFKVANTVMKSPGYKLVFVSGHFKASDSDPFLVSIVRPVSPPSILEIRMEGNMFVTHYTLEMRCTFFDGRLSQLLGYGKNDLIGHVPFEFHHHEDTEATLECSRGIMTKGEGLSGYYRFMSQFGQYLWIQSRATLMFDSRTGKPAYIVCMNFVISKEKGEKSLTLRQAITAGSASLSEDGNRSHDPFPIPREDGKPMNPLEMQQDSPQPKTVVFEEPHSTASPPTKPSTQEILFEATSSEPVTSFSDFSPQGVQSHSSTFSPQGVQCHSSTFSPQGVHSTTHQLPSSSTGSDSSPVPVAQPRSNSSSPEQCFPDSTVTSVPEKPNYASEMRHPSDVGYHSARSSILSPPFSSTSSLEQDGNRQHVSNALYSSYQSSPEAYSSVFSPESSPSTIMSPSTSSTYHMHSTNSGYTTVDSSLAPSPASNPPSCTPSSSTSYSAQTYSAVPGVEAIKRELMGQMCAPGMLHQQQEVPVPTSSWMNSTRAVKQEQLDIGQWSSSMPQSLCTGTVTFTGAGSESSPMVILDEMPSSLPQLNVEDLKVLEYIDQINGQESIRQFQYTPSSITELST